MESDDFESGIVGKLIDGVKRHERCYRGGLGAKAAIAKSDCSESALKREADFGGREVSFRTDQDGCRSSGSMKTGK